MDEHTRDPAGGSTDAPVESPAAPVSRMSPGPTPLPAPVEGAAATPEPPGGAPEAPSPAWLRFTSCRWHHAAEGAVPAHCTHRDVVPMAGVHGFNPESWCPDCPFYKLRRTVRRPPAY